MEPEKRIAELESQVRELAGLVQRLLEDRGIRGPSAKALSKGEAVTGAMLEEMRLRVDRALDEESDEAVALRTRAVWLGRLAIVVSLTALIFAAQYLQADTSYSAARKIVAGYALAMALIGYGGWWHKAHDLFARSFLGGGLAVLYFTTFALFFLPSLRLLDEPRWGMAALAACLLCVVYAAHRLRSSTIGATGILFALYTVWLMCAHPSPGRDEALLYPLLACPLIALAALLLHRAHGWTVFVGSAMLATQVIYHYYLTARPNAFVLDSTQYFWVSAGGLTACWFFYSVAWVYAIRRFQDRSRLAALGALLNTGAYHAFVQPQAATHLPAYLWAFPLGLTLVLVVLTQLSETPGPKFNPMFQAFLFQAVLSLSLTLAAAFTSAWLLLALALECLLLCAASAFSGIVVFKPFSLAVLGVTFAGVLGFARTTEAVTLGGYTIPANWFAAATVAGTMTFTACFCEHFVRRLPPRKRITSGQHFLAGTSLDPHGAGLAIVFAAAAAFVLLTTTIFEFGDSVHLPFVLAAEALAMAVLGLVLFTPPIEIACVLLLAGAHVCFHIFLWLPQPGFENQPDFQVLTILLALLTYVGAHAWERYLTRHHFGGPGWEHHAIAALPHLAATGVLTTMLLRGLPDTQVPAALGLLGAGLLGAGAITRLNGIKASGMLAVVLAVANFQITLHDPVTPLAKHDQFFLYFALLLGTLVLAERLFVLLQRYEPFPSRIEDRMRSLIVLLFAAAGMTGLEASTPGNLFLAHMTAFALLSLGIGILLHESRYRWGALAIGATMFYWSLVHFTTLTTGQQGIAAGVFAFLLLVIALLLTRRRRDAKMRNKARTHG